MGEVLGQFPEPKEVLGRWLGPSLDIGPAMTAKISKSNGQVLHLSSHRALNDDEWINPEEIKAREAYDKLIEEKTRQGNDL
jgi:hypothetical protein